MIEILYENIITSSSNKETITGLVIPFLVSFFALIFDKSLLSYNIKKISLLMFLFFITIIINLITVKYSFNDFGNIESLTFSSVAILSLGFFILYTKDEISLQMVFYFTFFSSLITDIIAAPNTFDNFLYGIGGAGIFDGLFLIPIIYTITIFMFNFSRYKRNKKLILKNNI